MSELVKCGNPMCGKKFPISTWKHPNRKVVHCPFCHTPHTTSHFDPEWKPNEKWHKGKHKSSPFTLGDMRRILQGLYRR